MPNVRTMSGDILNNVLMGFDIPVHNQQLEDMSQEELYSSVLTTDDPNLQEVLLMEVRMRGLVPLDWYNEDVIEYIRSDTTPPQTNNGIWIRSLLRDTRKSMSYDELTSYLRGDIDLPPLVSESRIIKDLRDMLEGSLGTTVRHWSNIELINFCTTDQRPLKTERGVYRNSPIRALKEASGWLDVELLDWVEGYIGMSDKVSEDLLLQQIRNRFDIPLDWSRADISRWVSEKIVPEHTKEGIWVNSQVRMNKSVSEWTTEEIVAYARLEITVDKTMEKDLLREIRSRYFYAAGVSNDSMLKDIRGKGTRIDLNSSMAIVESTIEFIDAITVAKSDVDAGYAHARFLRELRRVMTVGPAEFARIWTGVLNTASDNEAVVFNDVSVFRGFDSLTTTKTNRESYSQLLLLIINTMHSDTRYSVNNLGAFIEPIKWLGAKDNLRLYYGV